MFQQLTSFVDHYNEKYGMTKKSCRLALKPAPKITNVVLPPELPSMEIDHVDAVISEDTLNMVLHDCPEDQVLVDTVCEYRNIGKLILDSQDRCMPKRQAALGNNLIVNNKAWHQFAKSGGGLDFITFTDEELNVEVSFEKDENVMMVDDRKLIGVNIPPDDLVTCS
jgi:hypothetical protein